MQASLSMQILQIICSFSSWFSLISDLKSAKENIGWFLWIRPCIYPFMPSGLFYINAVHFNIRSVWLVFIVTVFYSNSCPKCKQCRPWSDVTVYTVCQCPLYEHRHKWVNLPVYCSVMWPNMRSISSSLNVVINIYIIIHFMVKIGWILFLYSS